VTPSHTGPQAGEHLVRCLGAFIILLTFYMFFVIIYVGLFIPNTPKESRMYGDDLIKKRYLYLVPTALCAIAIVILLTNIGRAVSPEGRLNTMFYLVLMGAACAMGALIGSYLHVRDDWHRFIGTVTRTWTETQPRYPGLPYGPTEQVFLFTLAETGEDRYCGSEPAKYGDDETPIVPGLTAVLLRTHVSAPSCKYLAIPMAKRYVPTQREQRYLDKRHAVPAAA